MLKLKDSVDFKELEIYGFKYETRYYEGYLYQKRSCSFIFIPLEDRKLEVVLKSDFDNKNQEILDLLYELSVDGLIEKVEE